MLRSQILWHRFAYALTRWRGGAREREREKGREKEEEREMQREQERTESLAALNYVFGAFSSIMHDSKRTTQQGADNLRLVFTSKRRWKKRNTRLLRIC